MDHVLRSFDPKNRVPCKDFEVIAKYRQLLLTKRILVLVDNVKYSENLSSLKPLNSQSLVLITSRNSSVVEGATRYKLGKPTSSDLLDLAKVIVGLAELPQALCSYLRHIGSYPKAMKVTVDWTQGKKLGAYICYSFDTASTAVKVFFARCARALRTGLSFYAQTCEQSAKVRIKQWMARPTEDILTATLLGCVAAVTLCGILYIGEYAAVASQALYIHVLTTNLDQEVARQHELLLEIGKREEEIARKWSKEQHGTDSVHAGRKPNNRKLTRGS
jgi:hypothetical protein